MFFPHVKLNFAWFLQPSYHLVYNLVSLSLSLFPFPSFVLLGAGPHKQTRAVGPRDAFDDFGL